LVESVSPQDPTPKSPRTELVGVFDTGGLQSISNLQVTNGKVDVGNLDPSAQAYLQFRSGQAGPVAIAATRTDETLPMTWSFDATDVAGNVTHSTQCPTDALPPTPSRTAADTLAGAPVPVSALSPGVALSPVESISPPGGASRSSLASFATAAAANSIRGEACAYYANVGLFGGPQNLRGCGQTAGGPGSESPGAKLQPNGSNSPQAASKPAGAKAQYGPAAIFAGLWPATVSSPPPSGPMSVRAEGTPAAGTVTASADIVLRTPADPNSPGGVGPGPFEAGEVHSTCTANESGVSGSATFVNGNLWTSTEPGGEPKDQEAVPNSPPVNYTRSGIITNVGDVFSVVYNQQIHNSDGSLTVNAIHAYLMGPTAVGELVEGQVICGTAPHPAVAADTAGPSCSALDVEPVAPDNPAPKDPRVELIGVYDAGGPDGLAGLVGQEREHDEHDRHRQQRNGAHDG